MLRLPRRIGRAAIPVVAMLIAPRWGAASAGALQVRQDTIVRMAGRPVHSGVARLVQELSIGVTDGPQEYMFGSVGDVAVGPNGAIYVFDGSVPELRHYDANGRYSRTIGRRGQGPGEYTASSPVEVMRDGRVLVHTTGRINVYSPSGEPIANWPVPSAGGAPPTNRSATSVMLDTADNYIYSATFRDPNQPRAVFDGTPVLIRVRANGTALDTIRRPSALPEIPFVSASGRAAVPGSGGTASATTGLGIPFNPPSIWMWSPLGYMVTSVPTRYSIELLPGRDSILSIRRDVAPVIIPEEERRAARVRVEEYMRRIQPNWSWDGPEIPRTKPVFEMIDFGMDGRIWVSLGDSPTAAPLPPRPPREAGAPRSPPGSLRPAQLYDVFEPSGLYLGQVEIPARTVLRVRRGDHVWVVSYDDDDVATVKRFRIAWR